MRYEKTFHSQQRGHAEQRLVLWSSLEDYELETYVAALIEAFPHLTVTLGRAPTGELAERLRRRDLGELPPDLVFGTAATILCEPEIAGLLAPGALAAAPALGPEQRWVAASGFRNAIAACEPALRARGLPVPETWAMLAEPRYRGLIALPDPAVSGAGTLALATLVQKLGPDAAWPVIAGLVRNAGALHASSWGCAKAALEPATPIAVSVEIACLRLRDQDEAIRVVVPGDASAVELEGFAMLADTGKPELCREILAWAVGDASRAIARRWRKVTLDAAGAGAAVPGSFTLDHARATRERPHLVRWFGALREPAAPLAVSEVYRHGGARDAGCLEAALREGISGNSAPVAAYERASAAQFGAAHAIAVSSGSAAVMAALAALRLPTGGAVVLSPLAPLCTVYPLMALGLEPVFCDTNPADFGLCLDDLERVLSPRTVAVLDVPMWGYPIPSDRVREACDRRGLPLVLDLAHGHAIRLHGRDLSTYGRIATFSSHEGKIISTGEGGMVLTDDAALASAVRSYARFGDLDGVTFGINLKLSGLAAALGERRMRAFGDDLAARRRKAELFLGRLDSPLVRPWPRCPGGEPNYYAILVEVGGPTPRGVIEALGAAGIPSDRLRYPCQALYRFELLTRYARPCPNAEALIARLSTVPVHPDLDDARMVEMAETINRVTARGAAEAR